MSTWKVLSPDEALTLLHLAGKYHKGEIELPPEIVVKKEEIETATRNAELFIARMRVVDHGMVDEIVQMKLDLDTLYGRWAQSATP